LSVYGGVSLLGQDLTHRRLWFNLCVLIYSINPEIEEKNQFYVDQQPNYEFKKLLDFFNHIFYEK
jgi:hypothetical protein